MGTGSTEPNGVQLRDVEEREAQLEPEASVYLTLLPRIILCHVAQMDIVRPTTVRLPSKTPEEEDQGPQSPDGDEAYGYPAFDFEVKEQDRLLPIANVARIMKLALPARVKIAKDAKECMQECVSEFISFITSEALEKCGQEKRKTLNGEDVVFAMTNLGFENYAEVLTIYLAKYREAQSARGESWRVGPGGTHASNYGYGTETCNNLLGAGDEALELLGDPSMAEGQLGGEPLRDEWISVRASVNPKPDIIRPTTVRDLPQGARNRAIQY